MPNILFIGDVVGASGVKMIREFLPGLRDDLRLDLVIANAENAAGGLGLTASLAKSLHDAGVEILTLGNHTWAKADVMDLLSDDSKIARPANGNPSWPGRGYALARAGHLEVVVISLLGQFNLNAPVSPFLVAKPLIDELREDYPAACFIVDIHAEATAEKIAMEVFLDGEVAAVLGTHTHVQTADERVTPAGTAYITDVGMTGPRDGIIGMSIRSSLRRFVDHLPARYELADGPCELNAVLISLNDDGRAEEIRRIHLEE